MDLFNDLEADLRRARLEQLWKKTMPFVLGGAVAIVLATIVYVAWDHSRAGRAQQATGWLLENEWQETKQLAEQGGTTAALANLKLARHAMVSGNGEEAAQYYEKASGQAGKEAALKQLAALLADYASGKQRLSQPMPGQPYYPSQMELLGWQQLAADKKEQAINTLLAIKNDAAAPPSQRARVTGALAYLAPQSLAKPVADHAAP